MIKPVFIPIQDGCLSINVAHILGVKPIDMGHYKGPRDIVELTLILTNGEEHKLTQPKEINLVLEHIDLIPWPGF